MTLKLFILGNLMYLLTYGVHLKAQYTTLNINQNNAPFALHQHFKEWNILGKKNTTELLIIPHMAFFCRIENHIEKKCLIPLRMRLGNLDYVNRLENKK